MPKFYTLFILLFFCIACKPKASLKTLEGKYITNIRNNEIYTAGGEKYILPVDPEGTIYYLVRHAEKDTVLRSTDPPLSLAGERRATALYDMFRGTDLDLIYSTMFLRTVSTVQELADQKGMVIKAYDPKKLRKMHSYIVDSTEAKRVLIVGHSNTTPVLANFLSDQNYFTSSFDEKDYDHLIIVVDNGDKGKELIPVKFKP